MSANTYSFLQLGALQQNTSAIGGLSKLIAQMKTINFSIASVFLKGLSIATREIVAAMSKLTTGLNNANLIARSANLIAGRKNNPFEIEYARQKKMIPEHAPGMTLITTFANKFWKLIADITGRRNTAVSGFKANYIPGQSLYNPINFPAAKFKMQADKENVFLGVLQSVRILSKPLRMFGNFMKELGKSFVETGKQQVKMQLTTAPMQAFWAGFLEPLEPIIELFGSFGEILGTGLQPAVMVVFNALQPLLPILQTVAQAIAGPLAAALEILMIPVNAFVQLIRGEIDFGQFLGSIGEMLSQAAEALMQAIKDIDWAAVGQFIWEQITGGISDAGTAMGNSANVWAQQTVANVQGGNLGGIFAGLFGRLFVSPWFWGAAGLEG